MEKKTIIATGLLTVAFMMLVACAGAASPTAAPATSVPAQATQTTAPPTSVPPTSVPPTSVPPTSVPPTIAPTQPSAAGPAKAMPGKAIKMVLLPKYLGIAVFDQAHQGAEEAAKELQNPTPLAYLGPTPENTTAGQIEILTNATTQGVNALMLSDGGGDQIVPAAQAAQKAGMKIVGWDSPIPSGVGEDLFVSPVDFDLTGKNYADMALDILGPNGGKFAILSSTPDAASQNQWISHLKQVVATDPKYAKLVYLDTVYGNDESELSYSKTLALVDKYPDMKLIISPSAVGLPAAAKALTDQKLCDKVKVTGGALPSDMVAYVKNGCSPEFSLWSFVDLGYLTYYSAYMLATGAIQGKEGESFVAGRMGTFTIQKDPTRPTGLRIIEGPFLIYNKDNIDKAVSP
jgi:rhamnose transport system substrate-binding protein